MGSQCNILVVDDEPIVGERLQSFLTKDGHKVEIYTDPVVAMEQLQKNQYDIVISDIRMAQMDGIEVMKQVLEKSRGTKVIMITGYATMELARESLTKGAFDFIAKPFKLKEIRQTIKRAVEAVANQASTSGKKAAAV